MDESRDSFIIYNINIHDDHPFSVTPILRMSDIIMCKHLCLTPLFSNNNRLNKSNCSINWLQPLHKAEKFRPSMFHTAMVKPKRMGPRIGYNTNIDLFSYRLYREHTQKNQLV